MMSLRKKMTAALTIGALALAYHSSVNAHHSFSIFAIEHKISLTGVLTDIRFINPHIMMEFETNYANGEKVTWKIESMAPSRFDRLGNDRDFAQVGDTATFYGWPARNCTDFMALSAIENPDKGTMVLTEEVRQGSAQAAVPEETTLCDSWPKQPVEGPKEDAGEVPAGEPVEVSIAETEEAVQEAEETAGEAEEEGFWKRLVVSVKTLFDRN